MRRVERLPLIYKAMRNELTFYHVTEQTVINYELFMDRYEELFFEHINNPDLRLFQHLYNNGIISDVLYYKEDDDYLIEKGIFKFEEIKFWGTRGLEVKENYKKWNSTKPELNNPITDIEINFYKWDKLKKFELYAYRFYYWLKNEPKVEYKPIVLLEKSHLEAILDTQKQISNSYREAFERVLESKL